MLKKLAYVLVGILVLFFLVAAFLPGSYTIERSIEIERPPEVVFEQVADYNKWLEWSPFAKMDPAAKQMITGTPATVGMKWSWEGEQAGVGSMTLASVEENRSIHSKLAFLEPMESQADDFMTLEPTASGTRAVWRNAGDLPYPLGRYFGLGVEGMLGSLFEEGLQNLKAVCESIEAPAGEDEEMETPEPPAC